MTTATQLKVGSVVRGSENFTNQKGVAYPAVLCSETVGSTSVFLDKVTIPPGERTRAHLHAAHESAYCILGGEEVEVFTGDRLENREIVLLTLRTTSGRNYVTSVLT